MSPITSVNTHKRHCQYRTSGRTVKLFSMYTWANRTIKDCRTLNIEDRRLNPPAATTNVETRHPVRLASRPSWMAKNFD